MLGMPRRGDPHKSIASLSDRGQVNVAGGTHDGAGIIAVPRSSGRGMQERVSCAECLLRRGQAECQCGKRREQGYEGSGKHCRLTVRYMQMSRRAAVLSVGVCVYIAER